MPVIPALERLRQEDFEFQPGLHSKTLSQKKNSAEILLSGRALTLHPQGPGFQL
jgi:hypothetical protein